MMSNQKNFIISASILSADFSHLADQIHEAENAGVDWLHIDVMDGHFVPNITMGPFIVETCRRISRLPLDVHLMIEEPERHLESFAHAGADWISIHVENNNNVHRTIQSIHAMGCKAGIVINPGTPVTQIASLMDFIDLVLIMTVNPGFSGQSFIPEMIKKITEVKTLAENFKTQPLIQVDGGINVNNLSSVVQAGAQIVVSASSIFNHPDGISQAVREFKNAI